MMWRGRPLRNYELTPQEAFRIASSGQPPDPSFAIRKAVACERKFYRFMSQARLTWAHMEVLRRLAHAADYYGQMAAIQIEIYE